MSRRPIGSAGDPPAARRTRSGAEAREPGRNAAKKSSVSGRPQQVDDLFSEGAMQPRPATDSSATRSGPHSLSQQLDSLRFRPGAATGFVAGQRQVGSVINLHSVFLQAEHARLDASKDGPGAIARAQATLARAQSAAPPSDARLARARKLLTQVSQLEAQRPKMPEAPAGAQPMTAERRAEWEGILHLMTPEQLSGESTPEAHAEVRERTNRLMQLTVEIDDEHRAGAIELVATYLRYFCAKQPNNEALRGGLALMAAFLEVQGEDIPFAPPELNDRA